MCISEEIPARDDNTRDVIHLTREDFFGCGLSVLLSASLFGCLFVLFACVRESPCVRLIGRLIV